MKLPLADGRAIVKILEARGFKPLRQKGSHLQLKDDAGRIVTVPLHPGSQIGRGLLRKILRDAEITHEEYVELEQRA